MIFLVESNEDHPVCPCCGAPLHHHDSRKRIWRLPDGKRRHLVIRRMRCDNCSRLHNELPDCLVPYKHYGTTLIEKVVDGRVGPDDLGLEDYPCERTMQRWENWIERNTTFIDGYIKSIGYRILNYSDQLLKSRISLLNKLRKLERHWLHIVIPLIYNSGEFLSP